MVVDIQHGAHETQGILGLRMDDAPADHEPQPMAMGIAQPDLGLGRALLADQFEKLAAVVRMDLFPDLAERGRNSPAEGGGDTLAGE